MKKIVEYFFLSELESAASKNFRVNLTIMSIGCFGMALLSIFVFVDSGFGLLFAGLALWHRYVMLRVSRVYLDALSSATTDQDSGAEHDKDK